MYFWSIFHDERIKFLKNSQENLRDEWKKLSMRRNPQGWQRWFYLYALLLPSPCYLWPWLDTTKSDQSWPQRTKRNLPKFVEQGQKLPKNWIWSKRNNSTDQVRPKMTKRLETDKMD